MPQPPSTPGHQAGDRPAQAQQSILKSIFSPAAWFSGGNKSIQTQDQENGHDVDTASDQDDEDEASQSATSSDEEEQIGLVPGSAYRPNNQTTPAQPHSSRSGTGNAPKQHTGDGSPNALLADFFARKGDQPLSAIELAGVQALLQGNSQTSLQQDGPASMSAPRQGVTGAAARIHATPSRRPYQPIFTPARQTPAGARTEMRKIVRPGYLSGNTTSSPFRQRTAPRTGIPTRVARPAVAVTPSKYSLSTQIPSNDAPAQLGKRTLDEIDAPAAKRQRPAEEKNTPKASSVAATTAVVSGQKTAASMLEILESNTVAPDPAAARSKQSPDQLKSMLNPYAPPSARKNLASPRRHQNGQRTPRSALEEIERSAAMAQKQPYQPKQASALAQSFTADDDEVSLFSPKRAVNAAATGDSAREHRSHGGFTFGAGKEVAPTPTVARSAFSAANGKGGVDKPLFNDTPTAKPHSTTPAFSFSASQKVNAPVFSFGTTSTSAAAEAAPPTTSAFSFTAPANTSFGTRLSEDSFSAVSQSSEHSKHGGFTFGVSGSAQVKPSHSSSARDAGAEDVTSRASTPALVHQLRDGTEYVSPSKARPNPGAATGPSATKPVDTAAAPTASSTAPTESGAGGPVFQPPTSTGGQVFSFGASANKTDTASSQPVVTGGFVFKPTSTAPASAKPAAAVNGDSVSDAKELVSKLTESQLLLDLYAFEVVEVQSSTIDANLRDQVMAADLINYSFDNNDNDNVGMSTISAGASKTIAATAAGTGTAPVGATGGFNWAAAGLAPPSSRKSGWTCSVCMLSNTANAVKCIACEADAPTASVIAAPAPAPAFTTIGSDTGGTTGGGFDWTAAGLKPPPPVKSGWSCDLCMVQNPESAQKCVACETDRP